MEEQDGKKQFNISERLEDLRRENAALRWEGSFRDYFELVAQNSRIAQLSHARINDMVHASGVERLNEGTQHEVLSYNFFSSELFGIEEPIARIVEYFKSAAQRLEVRKRILLLMGPVGGGKSTIVNMLKRGLEDWTKNEAGAVYAIKDCPMHEEPLHLIPHQLRAEIEKHYGIYIEGDLCPQCRYALDRTYGGRHEDVKVQRVAFSEKERVGIGTFSPSDPKSQDITELTGSIDLSTIGEVGVESDPRAYRFDGELNIANRGLMRELDLSDDDHIEFANLHSGVVSPHKGQLNPYYLGYKIYEDIERRWNSPSSDEQTKFARKGDEGREKIFEVRELENDVSFLRNYLTEDLCEELDLFVFELIEEEEWTITEKRWEKVRDQLVANMTNFGFPYLEVEDGDYNGNRELYLKHRFEGTELDLRYGRKALEHVHTLWGRPVHLETIVDEESTVLHFNGDEHNED